MTRTLLRASFLFVMTMLYIPMCVVVLFSFNHSVHSLIWHGWSWEWYAALWKDRALAHVTGHSFVLGVCAATGASLLGGVVSFSLYRYRFLGRRIVDALIMVLIIVPDLVMAIAMMVLFRGMHLPFGFVTLCLAHIAFCLPFTAMILSNRLTDLDPTVLLAAEDLGATHWQSWRWVIFPVMRSALLVSWLLSFMLSFDDVVISFFVNGPSYETLPLHIYAMARLGASPEINALCSLLLLLTVIVVCISQRMMRRA